jgi:hypothetical protein
MKGRTGMKTGAVFKIILFGMAVSALMLGCLNPVSFSSDNLPVLKMAGEISVDNINSAELNFRNHTLSVDVVKIDVMQHRVETSTSYNLSQNGTSASSTETAVDRLDARISGSPAAGTQDSVLVRPIDKNLANNITIKAYTVKVWYKKAQNFPAGLEGKFSDLQNPDSRPLEIKVNELPRGRCMFHLYRHQDGTIKIDVEGAPDDPDYNDYNDDSDFVMNVKSQIKVDLAGIEVAVALPSTPVAVTFSQELLDAANAAFGDLSSSLDRIATSVNNLAAIVDSQRLFGKNTGLLVVMNSAPMPVGVGTTKGSMTHFLGPVAPGDMDGILLSTEDGNKYQLQVSSGNEPILIRNTFVFNQKISYLHVYVNQGGKVVSDVTDSPNRPDDAKPGYGRLRIKNHSDVEITNILFRKKIGVGASTIYDNSKSFVVQKVSPGSEYQYASVSSDKVEEGNYTVFCTLADGRVVFDALDFYVLPDDKAYQTGDNVINIYQADISPPPVTITYTVSGNGGPPAAPDMDSYTTTKFLITFSKAVPGFAFQRTSMASGVGLQTKVNDYTWELEITAPVQETAKFKIDAPNVDNAEHQILIYTKDSSALPSFVPVTDVVVLNNERFTKGTPKAIQWKIVPENATNSAVQWTFGEADPNVLLSHLYGLGANGKQHTDTEGRLSVTTSWAYDYLYLAVVVPNGKAAGSRSLKLSSVGQTVVDVEGNSGSVTLQALYIDPDKDFVKVFRFIGPDVAPPNTAAPPANYQNVVFNYIGRGAGANSQYLNGEWSVNLIEVYQRPQYLTTANNTLTGSIGGGLQYKVVTDRGGGAQTSGNPLKGKTGVWWQPNPGDEENSEFGGTSEGWITGNWGSINESSGVASRAGGVARALEALPYPPPGAPANAHILSKDRKNMAFAYGTGGTYSGYLDNFYGETRQYFWGSVNLGDNSQRGECSKSNWDWLQIVSDDNKLNASGEQVALRLPTDKGPLWIRLRMDYSNGTVGYWWKAVGLQEWFVFDPAQSYRKDSKGNVIIDVDLYATPYMTYREK